MKTHKRFLTTALAALATLTTVALLTCRNPLLSVGLGDKVDILPPGISIVSSDGVQNGAYVHGTVTVRGTSTDDVSVQSVSWSFTDGQSGLSSTPAFATLDETGMNWSFVLNTAQGGALYADGDKDFVLIVTDQSGKSPDAPTSMLLIFDNTPPSTTFVNPPNGATVYNSITLRGASSDNTSLIKVQVRIGNPTTPGDPDSGFADIVGSKYDWVRTFFANDYANATQSTLNPDGTWTLPVFCRVYDNAGNVSTNEPASGPLYPAALVAAYGGAVSFDPTKVPAYSLVVDLDRDKPTATIQTPRDGANVAGTVVVSGTCFDENPGMKKVEIRIQALEDDGDPIGDYVTPLGAAEAAPGWIETTLSGGSYWQASLNGNEKLYNVTAIGGAYPGMGVHNGRMRIEIKPTDLNNKEGNVQTVTIRLDRTIPRLENPKIEVNGVDKDAWDYLYVRDAIVFKARASDDQSVTSIKVSLDGGSSYGPELIGSDAVPDGPTAYTITKVIDTRTDSQIPAGTRSDGCGLLTMVVKVQDNATPAPYVNTWLVTLNLDNKFPTVSYTGLANGHDPMLLSGNKVFSSQVMGSSADSGTVSGIDKAEVYLIKGLYALNLSGGVDALHAPATFGDPGVSAPYTTDSACKVTIDGTYADRALQRFGASADWWALLNTMALPDGPLEIHYVAIDKAGNSTHGSTAGYIVNNAPLIDSITLGTDVNGDGSIGDVASGESKIFSSGYAATGFTVRNGKLQITVAASRGNGTKRYSMKYAGTEKNTDPANPSVTITDFAGMPDGAVNGSAFDVLVYDSTVSNDAVDTNELKALATLGMTFDNVDGASPTVSVAPFGKRYGSSDDDSAKSLATVGSYNDNIVMNASVRAGHVEYQGQSLLDGSDADISGQVILRGKAADNQRIKSITVQIPGYDPPDPDGAGPLSDPGGAGAEFEIAAWSGGALASNYSGALNATNTWSLSLEAPYLTELHGHALNWAFSWNSASIANYAQTNVTATFRISDHASPSNTGLDPVTVDVVPYIAALKTTQTANGGIKANNIRSSLGKYSIKTGAIADFITVEGFNLNPIANGVRVSSAAYPSGLNGTTLVGNSLTVNAVSADRTTVTVSNATGASGYLTVVSGTAGAPIPSGNNGNNDDSYVDLNGDATAQLAEQYNREPDEVYARNRLLTDDRYIDFFTVTNTGFTSSYFPNMLMSGDTPIWGYIQGGAANDLQVRRGTNSGSNIGLIRILSADQLAMAQDGDGFYHMVSVNNFNGGRMVYVYNIFETTPGYAPNGGAIRPYWNGYTGQMAESSGNNAIELDSVNYVVLSLGRYNGIQMVVKGNSNTAGQYSRVYLGYYDQNTGELLFRNFRVGLGAVGNNLYNTGRSNQADTTVTSGDAARKLVSSSASQYFAMGVTDQNRVVFVYYDQAAGRLKVTYSTAAIDLVNPTDAVTFSSPVDIPVDYVGWYVSLAIESDGNAGTPDPIHITAYDTSDGDLRYVHMTSYADASPQVVRVDANNSVGIYTSIKVRGGKPWIAYYNNSENGTRDSIKLARYLGSMTTIANGAGADGFATGEWEYLTVPVTTPPQGGLTKFLKVNLDFNTSGDPILGYAASSIEHSRHLPEVTP
jgi:hypothetical protein